MLTVREINHISSALGRQAKGIEKAIHRHALVIGEHISKHGDVTIADFLVKQLGEGMRKNALREWFIAFGGCTWNADKKSFGKKKDFVWSASKADEKPWFLFKPEPEFRALNSETLLKLLLAKLSAGLDDNRNTIKREHIQALQAALDGKPAAFIVPKENVVIPKDEVVMPVEDKAPETNVVEIAA